MSKFIKQAKVVLGQRRLDAIAEICDDPQDEVFEVIPKEGLRNRFNQETMWIFNRGHLKSNGGDMDARAMWKYLQVWVDNLEPIPGKLSLTKMEHVVYTAIVELCQDQCYCDVGDLVKNLELHQQLKDGQYSPMFSQSVIKGVLGSLVKKGKVRAIYDEDVYQINPIIDGAARGFLCDYEILGEYPVINLFNT